MYNGNRRILHLTLLAWMVCLAVAGAAWSFGPIPTVLGPKTHRSPSGRHELQVNPTQRYGEGPAWYRMRKDGREIWAGKRPFTLYEAVVADDGTVGGFGYLGGALGGDPFVVAVLAPDGRVMTDHRSPRTGSAYLHTPPNPLAEGVIAVTSQRELIVRVGDEDVNKPGEWWWVYPLDSDRSKSGPARKVRIQLGDAARSVMAARSVAGTPLILTHWWRARLSFDDPSVGAIFALLDGHGKVVWKHELPNDYLVPGNEKAEDALREQIRTYGAILKGPAPGQFEVRFAAANQRVKFGVRPQGSGWAVQELGRSPYVAARPQTKPRVQPVSTERTLRPLGAITLRPSQNPPVPAVRRIYAIAAAGENRIVCLRAPFQPGDGERAALLLREPSGKLREVSLASLRVARPSQWGGCAWLGGLRFIVTRSDYTPGEPGAAWWAEFDSGKITPIPDFRCGETKRVVGYPDGGFVVLGQTRHKYSFESVLYRFDRAGRLLWKASDDARPHEKRLEGDPKDVAISPSGRIYLLGRSDAIGILDGSGNAAGKINLVAAGTRLNSGEEIAWGGKAELLVRESRDSNAALVLNENGKRLRVIRPRHRTGHRLAVVAMAPASSGGFWCTDRRAVYRIGLDGAVKETLGEPPTPALLREPTDWQRGAQGEFYVLDDRTSAVHVFEPDGRPRHVLAAPLGPTEITDASFAADARGNVDLLLSDWGIGPGHRARFGPTGRRLGMEKLELDIGGRWHYQSADARCWRLAMDAIRLVRADGGLAREIQRRPDGGWLASSHYSAVAADGSLAVLEGIPGSPGLSLHLYGPQGQPLKSWNVPSGVGSENGIGIALDGKHVYLVDEWRVHAFERGGKLLWKSRLPATVGRRVSVMSPMLDPRKNELLLYNGKSTVYRFAL